MVDKIDRPDPISKYEIQKSAETHDEKQRQHDERHEEEDEFTSPGIETSWNKFREDTPRRQVITLQRDDVRQAIFRQASLKHRSTVLEADLILKDGRTLSHAAYVSNNMDDYWKWKGWVPGQVVPIELMVQGQVMQVSIPMPGTNKVISKEGTGSSRIAGVPSKAKLWQDSKTGQLNWLWLSKVGAAVIVGLWVVGKLARWW
ncbi:MAG: hypothetical protein COV45_03810 [Deltaproteobacteria bacterium CG11_big_fil_rev_8_21_14_0_20_47_16]|nr:MAG: hypothetical protein COV45_03810 [Deltaproteobacteria bacterium CG11_big_fil_rev_8_21_14_0_20_47_16]